MNKLAYRLDLVANELESKGLSVLAGELDAVANSLEHEDGNPSPYGNPLTTDSPLVGKTGEQSVAIKRAVKRLKDSTSGGIKSLRSEHGGTDFRWIFKDLADKEKGIREQYNDSGKELDRTIIDFIDSYSGDKYQSLYLEPAFSRLYSVILTLDDNVTKGYAITDAIHSMCETLCSSELHTQAEKRRLATLRFLDYCGRGSPKPGGKPFPDGLLPYLTTLGSAEFVMHWFTSAQKDLRDISSQRT